MKSAVGVGRSYDGALQVRRGRCLCRDCGQRESIPRLGVWDGVKARKTRCLEAWRRRKRGSGGIYRFFSVPWLRRCCRLDFLLGLLGQKSASFRVPAKYNPQRVGRICCNWRSDPASSTVAVRWAVHCECCEWRVSARSWPLSAPLNSMPILRLSRLGRAPQTTRPCDDVPRPPALDAHARKKAPPKAPRQMRTWPTFCATTSLSPTLQLPPRDIPSQPTACPSFLLPPAAAVAPALASLLEPSPSASPPRLHGHKLSLTGCRPASWGPTEPPRTPNLLSPWPTTSIPSSRAHLSRHRVPRMPPVRAQSSPPPANMAIPSITHRARPP